MIHEYCGIRTNSGSSKRSILDAATITRSRVVASDRDPSRVTCPDLSNEEAKRIAKSAQFVGSLDCLSLAARDDARFDYGSYQSPCCVGGSACTHPYRFAVSAKERELCIE